MMRSASSGFTSRVKSSQPLGWLPSTSGRVQEEASTGRKQREGARDSQGSHGHTPLRNRAHAWLCHGSRCGRTPSTAGPRGSSAGCLASRVGLGPSPVHRRAIGWPRCGSGVCASCRTYWRGRPHRSSSLWPWWLRCRRLVSSRPWRQRWPTFGPSEGRASAFGSAHGRASSSASVCVGGRVWGYVLGARQLASPH